ncbi:tRNA pseudouridine(55) synthase TruB [Rhodovulum sp. DZ06]|uniref:tRNA pseudouridine(55) synthase TruB n=1 Tax=Rhodovulum sp. DZ06 TaxID=3425126 RepID=UPI003D342187
MARRKKGDPVDGWLLVDKPLHVTSTQVVAKARWGLKAQKAGHSGTLDPLATGVVAVALGEATKTVPYVTDALKAYRFTVRWGGRTSTDDLEGEVVETSDLRPTGDEIRAALPRFTGEIEQVPPAYSAIKVDGRRAYDLARAGEAVALKSRPLWVEKLELLDMPDADHAAFELVCGKGGYVRSIARDLGDALGCLGHVTALRRIWSGPFELSDCLSWEELETLRESRDPKARLLPVAAGLHDLQEHRVDADAAARLRQGRDVAATAAGAGDDPRDETAEGADEDAVWASHDGEPVAIGTLRAGRIHPVRVFPARTAPDHS